MDEFIVKIILIVTIGTIAVVWRITSPWTFGIWLKRVFSRLGLLIGAIESLLLLQIVDIVRLPFPSSHFDREIALLGLGIHIAGAVFAIWAKLTMKENWGVPAQHDIKKQTKLVTAGPFRFSRNPIYVGLLLALVGFEMALRSYLLFLIIPLFILINTTIKKEEALLEKHFGKQYATYKQRVHRFL